MKNLSFCVLRTQDKQELHQEVIVKYILELVNLSGFSVKAVNNK